MEKYDEVNVIWFCEFHFIFPSFEFAAGNCAYRHLSSVLVFVYNVCAYTWTRHNCFRRNICAKFFFEKWYKKYTIDSKNHKAEKQVNASTEEREGGEKMRATIK